LINDSNERTFVKFHWRPLLGTHGLAWDEAQKLAGQDPDFHRRDLWEAIDSGNYPEYEFGLQLIPEVDEHSFDFDLLDATKLVPEELVSVRWVGKMTLNRNPSEFFPEVEQVAFCTQNIVPGIDFSNDPLLQARNFSYLDTQLLRLGGPNFPELPINRPICPFMNHQRGGFMRQRITVGKFNYWPNRDSVCRPGDAFDNPEKGFEFYPEKIEGPSHSAIKTRLRSPKFAEHFKQATLFWNSLSNTEKAHLISAGQFELGRCDDKGVHQRVVNLLNHVDFHLAQSVGNFLGIEVKPLPTETAKHPSKKIRASLKSSPALSMDNTAKNTIATRRIAFLVADGYDAAALGAIRTSLKGGAAITFVVGPRRGPVLSSTNDGSSEGAFGEVIPDFAYHTARSTLFDAIVVIGNVNPQGYAQMGPAIHFVNEAYQHCKPIGAIGNGITALRYLGIQTSNDNNIVNDKGVLTLGTHSEWAGPILSGTIGAASVAGATSENPLTQAAGGLAHNLAGNELTHFAEQLTSLIAQHRFWNRNVSAIPA